MSSMPRSRTRSQPERSAAWDAAGRGHGYAVAKAVLDVALLAGGCSPEHEVSRRSAAAALLHFDAQRWRVWPVYLDRDGQWWVPSAPGPAVDANNSFGPADKTAMLPGAAVAHLIEVVRADIVFPLLHGVHGEDGTVQGMLELHNLAFVGSGCAASAVALDKLRTRECLAAHAVPLPPCYLPDVDLASADPLVEAERVASALGFPCFLKCDWSGSTLGVARAESRSDVANFLRNSRRGGRRFLAEAAVVGGEISGAVIGNRGGELEALPAVGIYPVEDDYFSHEAKYASGKCLELIPPRGLTPASLELVADLACRCHAALCCDGVSRTDMIVTVDGPVVLEVNTIPGLTEASLLPQCALARGLGFAQLLDRLLELGLARAEAWR